MSSRKLIKCAEYPSIMADGHVVEGTRLYVLELLMFGFAYASYYLLLKSRNTLEQLADEDLRSRLVQSPTQFGKHLEFGRDLERDPQGQIVYYIAHVADKDLLTDI